MIKPTCAFVAFISIAVNLSAETFDTTTITDARSYDSGEELVIPGSKAVTVAAGGSISYDATKVSDATAPVLTVGAGAELKVQSGGAVSFTDYAGLISFAGTETSPCRLTIDGGEFSVSAKRYSGQQLLGKMVLGEHSVMEVKGSGVFEQKGLTGTSSPRSSIFSMAGGFLYMKDDSVFKMGDVGSAFTLFSNGYAEFSGNAALDYCSGVNASMSGLSIGSGSQSDGMSAEVVFRDHACTRQTNYGYPTALRLANPKKGTWTTLRLESDGDIALGAITYVSIASTSSSLKGGVTLEVRNGYAQSGGNYGMRIAHVASGTAQVCTGIVNVAGGTLVSRATQGGSTENNKQFCGLIVGHGPAIDGAPLAFAELNVSSGIVTNWYGYFAIGTGRAEGRVLQTGGEIVSTPLYARPMSVGLAGGTGSYVISNGTTTASTDLYVGGVPTETAMSGCGWRDSTGDGSDYTGEDYSRGGAHGRLVVAAANGNMPCSLTLSPMRNGNPGFLHVGENGTGEVEIGEGGHVNCRGLTLAGPSATLKFTLGETGKCQTGEAAFLRIKSAAGSTGDDGGLLTIGTGAKLVVDASNYTGSGRWVLLALPNRREGTFAAEDITVLGSGEVVQDRPGYRDSMGRTGLLWYHHREGAMLIVR